jgi:acylphosphatase
MESTGLQKIRVVYSGRVQGVGFRMTVHQLAQQYPVVGMVRNVSDGTVELVAVGAASSILDFLKAVDRQMSRNIVGCTLDWLDATEHEFVDFSIAADKLA